MDRQVEEEKEKKRIADRRKTQHGVMPSQPVKTKVSILHLMKHTGSKEELYRALAVQGKHYLH
jgi:hypothetical protein